MYRFFENLVNPYADRSVGTPPRNIIAFIRSEMHPFRRIIPFILFMSFAVAIMETWLISYSGKVIDYINVTDKSEVWSLYGFELFLVALFSADQALLSTENALLLAEETLSATQDTLF